MEKLKLDVLSPFGKSTLKLDLAFSELERLSAVIRDLPLGSDFELERAVKLIGQFTTHSQEITEGIATLAHHLETARGGAERATQIVSEVALQVQARQNEKNGLAAKFARLGEKVHGMNSELAALGKPAGESFTDEEKALLPTKLRVFDGRLSECLQEAQALRAEAREAQLKTIERQAESLHGVLSSAREKLAGAIGPDQASGS